MIETLAMAMPIAIFLLTWRHGLSKVRQVWGVLSWWERVLLVVCCFLPLPGPFDEITIAVLVARGLRRLA